MSVPTIPPDRISVPGTTGERAAHVELRLAADLTWVPVARAVAAELAMRADFDLDAIADFRLAVDEACASMMQLAAPGSHVTCRFQVDADELQVQVSTLSARADALGRQSFGWQLLTALTDAADASVAPPSVGHAGRELRIDLVKRRAPTVGAR
ncbi:ATP-binding protein [Gandjariella thermophila]|uniref:Anti-sigma factor n=1 Tax=Gandjariella thermophila TaxID=1931992 RepID=A0A4D4J3G9_9PSEU|nr:ATP-binding protein [Gandjariella thermophila]GDY29036.1 anti-sigma factor [Gandjariella thermophila]